MNKKFRERLFTFQHETRMGLYSPVKQKALYDDESEHRREAAEKEAKFRVRLEKMFGMYGHPKAGLLYSMATDYGRSGGLHNMIDVYLDFVKLVKEDEDGSVQAAAPAGGKRRSRSAAVPDVQRKPKPAALRAKEVRAGSAKDRDDADRKVLRAGKGRGGQGRVGRPGQRKKLVKKRN